MKKKLILLLGLFMLFFYGKAAKADTLVDPLLLKSDTVLHYFIEGRGAELNACLREDLKSQLPPGTLSGLFAQLEAQYGKLLRTQDKWLKTKTGEISLYYKDLEFEKLPLRLLLGYEANGALNTLRIVPGQPVSIEKTTNIIKSLYKEKDITVSTGDFHLPGKLMLPEGKGPFPLVILVHGSGMVDKDETIGPNKVFLDIANGLAKNGIATLRYDKRVYVYKKNPADFNEESVDDAVSAVKLSLTLPEVDDDRIYVLGHSQGGRLLPRITARANGRIQGCIGLAASARPLQIVLPEQVSYLSNRVKGFAEQNADFVKHTLAALPQSYLKDDKDYDAPSEAAQSKVSFCFLQGGKDYNVTSTDFNLWKKALPKAQFKWFPQLDHLFMVVKGEPASDYPSIQKGHVSDEAIQAIAEFIKTGKLN